MKKKSSALLIISLALLMLLGSTTLSIVYIVNTIEDDAKSINDAGIIRGSVQRLTKLESNNIRDDKFINEIDKRIHDFRIIAKSPQNIKNDLGNLSETMENIWNELKGRIYDYRLNPTLENNKALINTSEELWVNTNETVYETQIISENKVSNFKMVFPFLAANVLLLIILTLIIKRYVRDQLEHAVNHDPLTKIYNRQFYYQTLRWEIQRAQRYGKLFSLITFDIDHFKKVNDTFGHDVGDYVLKELSKLCQDSIRKTDVLARIGGEEFSIIAPETDISSGVVLAEKLRRVVEEYQFNKAGHISISLGVAQYITGDSLDDIYKRADVALYKAKDNGRNRIELEH